MSPDPAREPGRAQQVAGLTALVLGALVIAAALLLPPRSAEALTPLTYTGLNAALCFVVAGAALLARRARAALAALAGVLLLGCALALLLTPLHGLRATSLAGQFLFNAAPAAGDAGLWPGRLRPGAVLAFLCAGPAFLLLARRAPPARLVAALGVATAAVAVPSLLSNLLGNMLFGGDGPAALLLPVPTALGVLALGMGLFRAGAPAGWQGWYAGREDRRLFITSLGLFAAMSLVASLAGIGVVGRYTMANFQQEWLASFRANADLFRLALQAAGAHGGQLVRSLSGSATLTAAGDDPDRLRMALARLADASHLNPDSGLELYGPGGRLLASVGAPAYRGQTSVALPLPHAPRLYWEAGWHVLTEAALPGGRRARLDLALTDFNRKFAQMAGDGRTREVRVCARADAASMLCFPSRLAPAAMRLPLAGGAAPLPIQRALAGDSGVVVAPDYRGEEVIAAYGMVAGAGLGLVQKVDSAEFYGPLRQQLWVALAGMSLLILAGASLLYWRAHPLVLGLIRTRARLDAILHNVPAGVLTFDQDGLVLSANHMACQMFGCPHGALLGRRIEALLDGGAVLLDGAATRVHQLAGRRLDGSRLALEVRVGGFVLGRQHQRIAIVQDVGERLRMEQALRQREASLAHAQQLAHIGSWERDLVNDTYFWSDETFRIFGLAPRAEAPSPEEVQALVHPDDRALKRRIEAEAEAARGAYDASFRLLLPGGAIKVVHSRAETVFDGAGRALRMRGTLQDITAKTWADEQLRKREEEYRALVEHLPDVVARFDRELRCVYVNPALAGAAGLAPVLGYGRVLDAASPAGGPWARAVRAVLDGSRAEAFEVQAGLADGVHHYQVRAVPELRQGGQVTAVLATARDISAIRAGEQDLRASRQLLRDLSAHQQRLREDERKRIAREVHDELGQALTALRMDVALLGMRGAAADPALLASVAGIKEAVDRTIGIVRNLTSALRPAALDLGLGAALEWQVDEFARRAGIACTLEGGETEVALDDDQATALFRIVQESLTNVLKHAHAQAVTVRLAAADGWVRLAVCDDGVGIAPAAARQSGKFGLVGMRERVLTLGGTLEIHSTHGHGTCIEVRLPLLHGDGATAPQAHD